MENFIFTDSEHIFSDIKLLTSPVVYEMGCMPFPRHSLSFLYQQEDYVNSV